MLWIGHRGRRGHIGRRQNDRSICLADVIEARYRSLMIHLTDDELRLLQEHHEQRADECRSKHDDEGAIEHDDRALELQAIRDLFQATLQVSGLPHH